MTYYERNREKVKARAAAWYEAHKEHCTQRSIEYNKKHREARLEITRRYYQRHKDKWKKWRAENPVKAARNAQMYCKRRRARRLGAQGTFTFVQWMHKVAYHGWRCFYCRKRLTLESLTMDHFIPLSKGGSNWLANIKPACKSCNSSKGAKIFEEPKK